MCLILVAQLLSLSVFILQKSSREEVGSCQVNGKDVDVLGVYNLYTLFGKKELEGKEGQGREMKRWSFLHLDKQKGSGNEGKGFVRINPFTFSSQLVSPLMERKICQENLIFLLLTFFPLLSPSFPFFPFPFLFIYVFKHTHSKFAKIGNDTNTQGQTKMVYIAYIQGRRNYKLYYYSSTSIFLFEHLFILKIHSRRKFCIARL